MKTFYVTFGGLLFNYFLVVRAKDEHIVRAFMNRKSKLGCWCSVQDSIPTHGQALNPSQALDLHYESAEHV